MNPLTEVTIILPFLKSQQKKAAGIAMTYERQPDEGSEKPESMADDSAVDAASEDLIKALHARDVKGVSAALKAAFEILDSMPHEEGPHESAE